MSLPEKRYNGSDKTIKYTMRPDDIDPYDNDPNTLRTELPCGHVVGPQTLTDYCKSQLQMGFNELKCPALINGDKSCGAKLSYGLVRKLALLTADEQRYFEKTLGAYAVRNLVEYKSCPECKSFIERQAGTNLSVQCTLCTAKKGSTYEFCWQCLRQWKGRRPRSDRCDNDGCSNKDLDLLKNCKTIVLKSASNIECPSIRACPTCGILIEHNTEKCKNILCANCKKEFCFVCLKLTPDCLKTSTHFKPCSDGVAKRQTSIPPN